MGSEAGWFLTICMQKGFVPIRKQILLCFYTTLVSDDVYEPAMKEGGSLKNPEASYTREFVGI